MRAFLIFTALLLLAMLPSCNKEINLNENGSFNLNDTINVTTGCQVINEEYELAIRIDSVLNDSRCPVDVVCVWEGNAEVRLIFSKSGNETEFVLNTHGGNNFSSDTIIGGFQIELIGLEPDNEAGKSIDQSDYVAEVVITNTPR